MEMPKGSLTSKTVWYALATTIISNSFPEVFKFIAANPELFVILNSIAVIVLRALTKKPIRPL